MAYINSQSFEEIKHHGNKLFPISAYPVTCTVKGPILQFHWHKELEFLYLAKGEAVFTIDDNSFTLKAGECVFINSGKIHSGYSITVITQYISVVFDINLLTTTFDISKELFNNIVTNRYNIIQHFTPDGSSQSRVISELKNIITELKNKNFAYELVIKSNLLSIFTIIPRNSLYTKVTTSRKNLSLDKKFELFKEILSFIENNSNNKIKLSDISNKINLTPQYLCIFFKYMTNMSIIQYINNYKIEKAASMLKISNLTIPDIAL
ncbi:MAG TPA: hypothetical protein DG753_07160 [Clostridium sp.]|nr:hypothetical protein [Clostridium sp.]